MEKINIAEILKDCPSGMELDCTIVDGLYFDKVTENNTIKCYSKRFYESTSTCNSICFYSDGSYLNHTKAKCVIFPKGKTTWKGFQRPFKDGDIVYTCNDDKDEYIFIFESITENTHVNSYLHIKDGYDLRISKVWLTNCDDKYLRFATEEEKQRLFNAIKANGYKWNAETKTLEKLIKPKFKVGNRIKHIVGREEVATVVSVEDLHYNLDSKVGTSSFSISLQREWELVPNKFDITTLKPFESKVLVRDYDYQYWRVSFFGYFDKFMGKFDTVRGVCIQCIPYEGNEHLLGTTDNCDNFYKTW